MFGQLLLLLSLATTVHRPDAARCERAYCRCIPASALGITEEQLVQRRREQAARVVLGRVVRVDSLAPYMIGHGPDQVEVRELAARVAVSRVWKGPVVDTLTVVFGTTGVASSCDLTLIPGFSYLIFAAPWAGDALHTRQCTGTVAEVDASTTIAALGPAQESRK